MVSVVNRRFATGGSQGSGQREFQQKSRRGLREDCREMQAAALATSPAGIDTPPLVNLWVIP